MARVRDPKVSEAARRFEAEFKADRELERKVAEESRYSRSKSPLAGTVYTAPTKPSGRPVTARPIGAKFTVRTRGRVPCDERGRKLENESLDIVQTGEGCYRRTPTTDADE